jgi:hypothetical protein
LATVSRDAAIASVIQATEDRTLLIEIEDVAAASLDTVQRVVVKHFSTVAFDISPQGTIFHIRLAVGRVKIY